MLAAFESCKLVPLTAISVPCPVQEGRADRLWTVLALILNAPPHKLAGRVVAPLLRYAGFEFCRTYGRQVCRLAEWRLVCAQ